MNNPLYQKNIISIADLSRPDLELILQTAQSLKQNPLPDLTISTMRVPIINIKTMNL